MRLYVTPALLLALASLTSVLTQDNSCNVQTGGLGLVDILSGGFGGEDLSFAPPSARNNEIVRLFDENDGGSITAFWFENKVRLDDGFRAVFTYEASQGNADGLAFVVQSDTVINTVSSGGEALGFRTDLSGLQNYLAVSIDFCSDRAGGTCETDEIRIDTRTNGGANVDVAFVDVSDRGLDSGTNTIRVDYLQNANRVEVFIENDDVAVLTGGVDLSAVLGEKFGHIGFSGSNSQGNNDITPVAIDIESLTVSQMNSGFRLDEESLQRQEVDFADNVQFTVLTVDSCNGQVPPNTVAAVTAERVFAVLLDDDGVEANTVILEFIPSLSDDTQFVLEGFTVNNVVTTYTLEIRIDGVLVQQNPLGQIVDAVNPDAGGLDPLGIGLLGALLLVLVIAVITIVFGVKKYRAQLIEHKDDIDHGKTKRKIDGIEKDIDYKLNPMVAPLDELKDRLAKNEKKIEQMKADQKGVTDGNDHVNKLQKENEALRAEMADLKRRKEFGDVGNMGSVAPKKTFTGGNDKADFGQEEV